MKRTILLVAASALLLTACGDGTSEEVSHQSPAPASDNAAQSTDGANSGMADTLSTNATLPGSATGTNGQ